MARLVSHLPIFLRSSLLFLGFDFLSYYLNWGLFALLLFLLLLCQPLLLQLPINVYRLRQPHQRTRKKEEKKERDVLFRSKVPSITFFPSPLSLCLSRKVSFFRQFEDCQGSGLINKLVLRCLVSSQSHLEVTI